MIDVCDKCPKGTKNIPGKLTCHHLIPLLQNLSLPNIIFSIIIEHTKTRRDSAKAFGGHPYCWVSLGFYIIELLEQEVTLQYLFKPLYLNVLV